MARVNYRIRSLLLFASIPLLSCGRHSGSSSTKDVILQEHVRNDGVVNYYFSRVHAGEKDVIKRSRCDGAIPASCNQDTHEVSTGKFYYEVALTVISKVHHLINGGTFWGSLDRLQGLDDQIKRCVGGEKLLADITANQNRIKEILVKKPQYEAALELAKSGNNPDVSKSIIKILDEIYILRGDWNYNAFLLDRAIDEYLKAHPATDPICSHYVIERKSLLDNALPPFPFPANTDLMRHEWRLRTHSFLAGTLTIYNQLENPSGFAPVLVSGGWREDWNPGVPTMMVRTFEDLDQDARGFKGKLAPGEMKIKVNIPETAGKRLEKLECEFTTNEPSIDYLNCFPGIAPPGSNTAYISENFGAMIAVVNCQAPIRPAIADFYCKRDAAGTWTIGFDRQCTRSSRDATPIKITGGECVITTR